MKRMTLDGSSHRPLHAQLWKLLAGVIKRRQKVDRHTIRAAQKNRFDPIGLVFQRRFKGQHKISVTNTYNDHSGRRSGRPLTAGRTSDIYNISFREFKTASQIKDRILKTNQAIFEIKQEKTRNYHFFHLGKRQVEKRTSVDPQKGSAGTGLRISDYAALPEQMPVALLHRVIPDRGAFLKKEILMTAMRDRHTVTSRNSILTADIQNALNRYPVTDGSPVVASAPAAVALSSEVKYASLTAKKRSPRNGSYADPGIRLAEGQQRGPVFEIGERIQRTNVIALRQYGNPLARRKYEKTNYPPELRASLPIASLRGEYTRHGFEALRSQAPPSYRPTELVMRTVRAGETQLQLAALEKQVSETVLKRVDTVIEERVRRHVSSGSAYMMNLTDHISTQLFYRIALERERRGGV